MSNKINYAAQRDVAYGYYIEDESEEKATVALVEELPEELQEKCLRAGLSHYNKVTIKDGLIYVKGFIIAGVEE